MKKVKIEIESTVEDIDDAGLVESSDKTSSAAVGTLRQSDGKYHLSYSETNEKTVTKSNIIADGEEIFVKRSGGVEYEFIFAQGKTTASVYKVPPYSFDTEIYTRKIRNSLSESGGEISLVYDMTIGGAKKKTRMKIRVSEQ